MSDYARQWIATLTRATPAYWWTQGLVAAVSLIAGVVMLDRLEASVDVPMLGFCVRAALDALLARSGQKITAAVSLEVDDEAMVGRVSGRYTCAGCGEGYHDRFKQPATAGTCDKCGGTAMKRRADDNAETVRERLKAYHAQTAPLIAYYEGKGVLERIDAMGPIEEVQGALAGIVGRVAA